MVAMKTVPTRITPVLTVRGVAEAISFYENAFGAVEVHRNTYPDGRIVAELRVDGARFRLVEEAAQSSVVSPGTLGGTSVRLNLFVTDPDVVAARAVGNGAVELAPIADQEYGLRQGKFTDPFGHEWLIGRPLPGPAGDWARADH